MKRMMLVIALLAGCRGGPPKPVDIEAGDACSLCRMAISEQRFAAELIDAAGKVFKFDDIGCMARFARVRRIDLRTAAAFVMDYDTRTWIPASGATYIKSPGIQSPMASGILAVRNAAAAETHSARYGAFVLNLEQVTWSQEP